MSEFSSIFTIFKWYNQIRGVDTLLNWKEGPWCNFRKHLPFAICDTSEKCTYFFLFNPAFHKTSSKICSKQKLPPLLKFQKKYFVALSFYLNSSSLTSFHLPIRITLSRKTQSTFILHKLSHFAQIFASFNKRCNKI